MSQGTDDPVERLARRMYEDAVVYLKQIDAPAFHHLPQDRQEEWRRAAAHAQRTVGVAPTPHRPEGETTDVYAEIRAERAKQDAKWGGPIHDDQHGDRDWARFVNEHAERAITARSQAASRYQWVRVAALAVAAVQRYDRLMATCHECGAPGGSEHATRCSRFIPTPPSRERGEEPPVRPLDCDDETLIARARREIAEDGHIDDYSPALLRGVDRLTARVAGLEQDVGVLPPGAHPDERKPRAATWLAERANWEAELAAARSALRAERERVRWETVEWCWKNIPQGAEDLNMYRCRALADLDQEAPRG